MIHIKTQYLLLLITITMIVLFSIAKNTIEIQSNSCFSNNDFAEILNDALTKSASVYDLTSVIKK